MICDLQSHWVYLIASPSERERQAHMPEWGGGALPLGYREQPHESIPTHVAEGGSCIIAAGRDEFRLGYHLSPLAANTRVIFVKSVRLYLSLTKYRLWALWYAIAIPLNYLPTSPPYVRHARSRIFLMHWYVTQLEFNSNGTINAVPVVLSSGFKQASLPHQRQTRLRRRLFLQRLLSRVILRRRRYIWVR